MLRKAESAWPATEYVLYRVLVQDRLTRSWPALSSTQQHKNGAAQAPSDLLHMIDCSIVKYVVVVGRSEAEVEEEACRLVVLAQNKAKLRPNHRLKRSSTVLTNLFLQLNCYK